MYRTLQSILRTVCYKYLTVCYGLVKKTFICPKSWVTKMYVHTELQLSWNYCLVRII